MKRMRELEEENRRLKKMHAQLLATQWLWAYNNQRPHTAIGGIPPRKLLEVA